MSDHDFAQKALNAVLAEAATFAAMYEEELQLDALVELARSTRDDG